MEVSFFDLCEVGSVLDCHVEASACRRGGFCGPFDSHFLGNNFVQDLRQFVVCRTLQEKDRIFEN